MFIGKYYELISMLTYFYKENITSYKKIMPIKKTESTTSDTTSSETTSSETTSSETTPSETTPSKTKRKKLNLTISSEMTKIANTIELIKNNIQPKENKIETKAKIVFDKAELKILTAIFNVIFTQYNLIPFIDISKIEYNDTLIDYQKEAYSFIYNQYIEKVNYLYLERNQRLNL